MQCVALAIRPLATVILCAPLFFAMPAAAQLLWASAYAAQQLDYWNPDSWEYDENQQSHPTDPVSASASVVPVSGSSSAVHGRATASSSFHSPEFLYITNGFAEGQGYGSSTDWVTLSHPVLNGSWGTMSLTFFVSSDNTFQVEPDWDHGFYYLPEQTETGVIVHFQVFVSPHSTARKLVYGGDQSIGEAFRIDGIQFRYGTPFRVSGSVRATSVVSNPGVVSPGSVRGTMSSQASVTWGVVCGVAPGTTQTGGYHLLAIDTSDDCDCGSSFEDCIPDADEDGIPDDWETLGIPYVDSGGVVQRIPLPGADPQRKDLFVEIDLMSGQTLDPLVISELEIAFDQAPVPNPKGRRDGIALHLVIDDQDLPFIGQWQVFGGDDAWPVDFDNYRLNSFGSIAERFHPDAQAMLEAKAKVYRYGIIASGHTPLTRNGNPYWVQGKAEGILSDNFIIYLDNILLTSGATSPVENEAAVIMHELGHCLGLSHGGCDNENQGQTNQPSVMNYVYAAPYNWNATTWRMDYLRVGPESLGPLVEDSLDETAGIGSPGGAYSHVFMPFGVDYCGNPPCVQVRRHDYVRLNGSLVDFGSLTPDHIRNQDGIFSVSVVQDLNYLADGAGAGEVNLPTRESPGETFSVCNEWERVAQNLQPVAARGTRGKIGPRPIEPSVADYQWIDDNLPPAPTICSPDLNGDGVLDLADLVRFVTAFMDGDPLADFTGEGVFDLADIVAFVSAFNAGCP